jgi:hypothetical protein
MDYPELKLVVPDKIVLRPERDPKAPLPLVPVTSYDPIPPLSNQEELDAIERENEMNEARIRYEVLRREAEEAKTKTPESFILKYKRDAMWTTIGMAAGAAILKLVGC